MKALGMTLSVLGLCLFVTACANGPEPEPAHPNGPPPTPRDAGPSEESTMRSPHDRAGYVTHLDDGRLWVFAEGSEALSMYEQSGEPARSITMVGAGPCGMSLRAEDKLTALGYLATKTGWATVAVDKGDGRYVVWAFEPGSEAHTEFLASGEPAKSYTLLGGGPTGVTLMAGDERTAKRYVAACAGFYTTVDDYGWIWAFEEGSDAHLEFLDKGEPAKRISVLGAGPMGETVISVDKETAGAYALWRPGFAVYPAENGWFWVFEEGSEAHAEFRAQGEPAKRVTILGAGPMGETLLSSETATIERYQGTARF